MLQSAPNTDRSRTAQRIEKVLRANGRSLDPASSLSKTSGKTAPAPSSSTPATSSSASSQLPHHRAFIWCVILASSQATPSFAPKSSPSRQRILPLSSRLRLPATSLRSPSSSPKLTTLALPVNVGPGCWLMCSAQILTLVCTAVDPCAGSKPPPPNKLLPPCSPSLVLLLNLLRRHHRFCSGSSGSSSVEVLTPGSCCPWGYCSLCWK